MKVVYFQRKPTANRYFSIENSFRAARRFLPSDVTTEAFVPSCESRGILRRVSILYEAARAQGDINHITGDIHFVAYALDGDRTVLTVHDCGILHRTHGARRALLERFWFSGPVARAAVVTTVSEFTRRELLGVTSCPSSKVHVIPTCISPAFQRVPKAELSDPPTILQIGTKPNKNIERLAAALSGLRCVLQIVGTLTVEQRKILLDHDITFTSEAGLTEAELLSRYVQCDVVAFVSTFEGFGMPVLEAQAVGRPVVTSTVTSLPEVAGPGACFVDPHDVAAIRKAFLRLLGDSRYRADVVEAGFLNHARFTAARVAEQYADLYRSIS